MKTTSYKHNFGAGGTLHTSSEPEKFHDHLIYERPDPDTGLKCYDVVKNGVCITQMAGPNGARKAIMDIVGIRFDVGEKVIWRSEDGPVEVNFRGYVGSHEAVIFTGMLQPQVHVGSLEKIQ